jgi:hypothetical protein
MVAVRDDEDRDLLGDDCGAICERPRAEHPVVGEAGGVREQIRVCRVRYLAVETDDLRPLRPERSQRVSVSAPGRDLGGEDMP